MKAGKLICRVALGALVLSAIPYYIDRDKETGACYVRSLLWAWQKTPSLKEDKDFDYAFAIPPCGLDMQDECE